MIKIILMLLQMHEMQPGNVNLIHKDTWIIYDLLKNKPVICNKYSEFTLFIAIDSNAKFLCQQGGQYTLYVGPKIIDDDPTPIILTKSSPAIAIKNLGNLINGICSTMMPKWTTSNVGKTSEIQANCIIK